MLKRSISILSVIAILFALLGGMPLAVSAMTEVSDASVVMGEYGVIYYLDDPTKGKSFIKSIPIHNNAEANEAVTSILEMGIANAKTQYAGGDMDNIPQINIVLCHDWTTNDFVCNNDYPLRIDLGGYTWTVNEISRSYGQADEVKIPKPVSISNGTLTVRDAEDPIFNIAKNGLFTANNVTFKDCHISGNRNLDCCGIVAIRAINGVAGNYFDVLNGSIIMKNVTFENCSSEKDGCCISVEAQSSNISLQNCLFTGCTTTGKGSVMYTCGKNNTFTFSDCRFLNCVADDDGGVIYSNSDSSSYNYCRCVAGGCVTHGDGGLLFERGNKNTHNGNYNADGSQPAYDQRTLLSGCIAYSDGGGIYTSADTGCGNDAKISGFNVAACKAGKDESGNEQSGYHWGGGMCLRGNSDTVSDCDFFDNYAVDYGGGLFLDDVYCKASNCTFEYNYAGGAGGTEIYVNDDSITIENSVIHSGYIESAAIYQDDPVTLTNVKFNNDTYTKFTGSGDEANPYLLKNGYDFVCLCCDLYRGATYKGKYFALTNDVCVPCSSGRYFKQYASAGKYLFGGTLDGRGHTAELWIVYNDGNTGLYGAGLFGYAQDATFKNLTVTGQVTGKENTGAICGIAVNCSFDGCRNEATVKGSSYTGGIAGTARNCTIRSCTNSGSVYGSMYTGGIVGQCKEGSRIENCRNNATAISGYMGVGGIAGNTDGGEIRGCVNNAAVSAAGSAGIATANGAAAGIAGGASGNARVVNCINTVNGTISSPQMNGGIVGMGGVSSGCKIENCANYGYIAGEYSGGIAGYGNLTASNCFNGGTVAGATNSAALFSTGTQYAVTAQNCYFLNGSLGDSRGTGFSRADCGKPLVKRMNDAIESQKNTDWIEWAVGGASVQKLATVNLDGINAGYKLAGNGTKTDPYQLLSAQGFNYIADEVMSGNSFAGKYFRVKKNITYSSGKPIGDALHPFSGFIEGGNHTVTVNIRAGGDVGLFGALKGATIQNLCILGSVTADTVGMEIYPAEGEYLIHAGVDDSKCVEIAGGANAKSNGDNVQIWTAAQSTGKVFKLVWDANKKAYKLEAKHSGLVVDIWGGSSETGANIWQWKDLGADNQRWVFENAGGGYVYIRSLLGTYMDVYYGNTGDGTNVWSYYFIGGTPQMFRLEPVNPVAPVSTVCRVGAVAGSAEDSLLRGVTSKVTVSGFESEQENIFGGLVGSSKGTEFYGCTNSGAVNGSDRGAAGGITGRADEGCSFEYCVNRKTVTESGGAAGGLAGILNGSVIRNSANYFAGKVSGYRDCGGLVGRVEASGSQSTIQNSANYADISADSFVGGILGNDTGATLTVENCLTAANVTAAANENYAAIAFDGADGNYENCFFCEDFGLMDIHGDGYDSDACQKVNSRKQPYKSIKSYVSAHEGFAAWDEGSVPTTNEFITIVIEPDTYSLDEEAAQIPVVPDGDYLIYTAVNADNCLEISGGAVARSNGGNLQTYTASASDGKLFTLTKDKATDTYKITAKHSGLVLDIEGGSDKSGANVIQWKDNATDNQRWEFEKAANGYLYIKAVNGNYLDVEGGSEKAGANVRVCSFSKGSKAQMFKLVAAPADMVGTELFPKDGEYEIYTALDPAMCLDISGGANAVNTGDNLQLWSEASSGAKVYKLVKDKNTNTYKIIPKQSKNLVLDIDGGSTKSGANVFQWTDKGGANQRWIIETAGDGYVYIRSLSGNFLDVDAGNGVKNGTNVRVCSFTGGAEQKFKLEAVPEVPVGTEIFPDEGEYVIYAAADESRCFDISGGANATSRGANLQLWAEASSGAKVYKLVKDKNTNSYKIVPQQASGLVLDVESGSTKSGANIIQWTDNGNSNQRWSFEYAGDGYVYIRSALGNYIDADVGSGVKNGTNLRTCTFTGGVAQKFRLEPVSSSTGSVLSEGSLWIIAAVALTAVGGITALVIVKKKKTNAASEEA